MTERMRTLGVLAGGALLLAGCGGSGKVTPPPRTTTTTIASTTSTTAAPSSGSHLSTADAGALDARLTAINAAIARRDRSGALRELASFAALVRADARRGKLDKASQQALASGIARTHQQIDAELPAKPAKGSTSGGPAGPTGANSGFGH